MMRKTGFLALAIAAIFCGAEARAAVLFSDGFESYNVGQLATTDANTANPGPNGGPGNPWWAPFSGNALVTGAANGVTPHSGSQMVVGAGAADFDQNAVNIAHRFNNNTPVTGNVSLDFYFYDVNGSGDAASTGYAEMGYYSGVPNNTDYNATHALTFDGPTIQRIILGTADNTGADTSVYQARVIGGAATIGAQYSGTYINTLTPRTIGWHEGRIVIGPQLPTGGNLVDFYIDNMITPDAEATTTLANGYNVMILNTQLAGNASTLNYFDDVTLSSTPEPGSLCLLGAGAIGLLVRRGRQRVR